MLQALNDKVYGVVYAREGNEAQLAQMLISTRVIPWRHVLHFSGVLERHVSAVKNAATAAGVILPEQQTACHLIIFEDEQTEQFKHLK